MSEQPVPGTHSVETETEAGRFVVPYLALLPMGFSVPRRLLDGRWALTPPFHPYRRDRSRDGGLFSVALSVGWPFGFSSRVYPNPHRLGLRGIAPCGVRTFLPRLAPGAILRPSKIVISVGRRPRQNKRRNHSARKLRKIHSRHHLATPIKGPDRRR